MKVLIIQTGPEIDVLFTTPLVRAINRQLGARVFCISPAVTFLADNPWLTAVYKNPSEMPRELRREGFDCIVDLDNNFRSRWWCVWLKGMVLRHRRLKMPAWLRQRLSLPERTERHIAERYLGVVAELGVEPDGQGPDCFIRPQNEVPPEWLPEGFQKRWVAFCISAPYATRQLPVNRMIELCDRINKPIILLGQPEDAEKGEAIAAFFSRPQGQDAYEKGLRELNKKTTVFNACGKFNLQQQASMVRQASHVFTFDSIFIPIASAFEKNVFTVWGNTVPAAGRYPWQTRFTVFENNKLACRPCSAGGYNRCPLGHFKCMNEVLFDFYLPD